MRCTRLGTDFLFFLVVETSKERARTQKKDLNVYPFGLKHKGYNNVVSTSNSSASMYKFQGVEQEEALGFDMYEMDWRQYDPAIARFTSIDPVTHHSLSTYNAFDNNPVFWADPSGADSVYNWDTGQYVIDGQEVSFDEAMSFANNGGNPNGNNNNVVADPCKYCIKVSSYDKDDTIQYTKLESIQTDKFVSEWQVEEGSEKAIKALKAVTVRRILGLFGKFTTVKDLAAIAAALGTGDFDVRSRVTNATLANVYSAYGDVYFDFSIMDYLFDATGRSEVRQIILRNTNTQSQTAIFNSNTGEMILDISNLGLDSGASFVIRSSSSVEDFD